VHSLGNLGRESLHIRDLDAFISLAEALHAPLWLVDRFDDDVLRTPQEFEHGCERVLNVAISLGDVTDEVGVPGFALAHVKGPQAELQHELVSFCQLDELHEVRPEIWATHACDLPIFGECGSRSAVGVQPEPYGVGTVRFDRLKARREVRGIPCTPTYIVAELIPREVDARPQSLAAGAGECECGAGEQEQNAGRDWGTRGRRLRVWELVGGITTRTDAHDYDSTPCFCVGIGDQHSGIVRLFEVV
jgi:hypothetical protein